jgi:preprotein translocase subunit SecB
MELDKSSFSFDSYNIYSLNFDIDGLKQDNVNINVLLDNLDYKKIKNENNELVASLDITLNLEGETSKNKKIFLSLKIIGFFSAKNFDENKFEDFCKLNGLMNLLSIARSFISTTTAQMGIPPLILPLLNINSSFEQKK